MDVTDCRSGMSKVSNLVLFSVNPGRLSLLDLLAGLYAREILQGSLEFLVFIVSSLIYLRSKVLLEIAIHS